MTTQLNHHRRRWYWVIIVVTVGVTVWQAAILTSKQAAIKINNAKVQQATQMLETIITLVPTAIVVCDDHGNVVYFNPAAEELFGYVMGELQGKSFHTLIAEELQIPHQVAYAESIRVFHEKPEDWEMLRTCREGRGLHKDGTVFPAYISIRGVKTGGEVMLIASIMEIIPAAPTAMEFRKRSPAKK